VTLASSLQHQSNSCYSRKCSWVNNKTTKNDRDCTWVTTTVYPVALCTWALARVSLCE